MSDDYLQPGDYRFDPRLHKEILKEFWVRESDEPNDLALHGSLGVRNSTDERSTSSALSLALKMPKRQAAA